MRFTADLKGPSGPQKIPCGLRVADPWLRASLSLHPMNAFISYFSYDVKAFHTFKRLSNINFFTDLSRRNW